VVLSAVIVAGIGAYLFLSTTDAGRDTKRNLLPYQILAGTLSDPDQSVFRFLQHSQTVAEGYRARTSRWPTVQTLAEMGVEPFAQPTAARTTLRWERVQQGGTVNYIGVPTEMSAPAWLLAIQEPDPGAPPDPAPLDEEHHRLPDGTTLHLYVWMHRDGGAVVPSFVRQPQHDGWIEVLTSPPNPVLPARR
jgi:hypothetical protein